MALCRGHPRLQEASALCSAVHHASKLLYFLIACDIECESAEFDDGLKSHNPHLLHVSSLISYVDPVTVHCGIYPRLIVRETQFSRIMNKEQSQERRFWSEMSNTMESTLEMGRQYERIAAWLESVGSGVHARRLLDILADPAAESTFTVAFCGLFSAGKSSLVSALSGTKLKTGANPTTAEVEGVRMNLPGSGGQLQFLDTPGIDSTDERHKEATMNALYQADCVVIVADYQHVEAEENLELLHTFVEEGKRLAFVVHQIDKHLESELPFVQFADSVYSVLADYGVAEDTIFFTTVGESPHNQLPALRSWLVAQAESHMADGGVENVRRRLADVAKEGVTAHFDSLVQAAGAAVAKACGSMPLSADEAASWLEREAAELVRVRKQYEASAQAVRDSAQATRESWLRLIELAQIAPYETTEKGRLYIESLRPEFKVGLFRSVQKTEAERLRRAEAFARDIGERVQNFLLTPLANQIASDVRQAGIDPATSARLADGAAAISIEVDVDYVARIVKPGALVSSQYPYQYVKDVVARVKRDALAAAGALAEQFVTACVAKCEDEQAATRAQIETESDRCAALQAYLDVCAREQRALDSVAAGEVPTV